MDLAVANPGAPRDVDLYVLLDVWGRFFAYPSWGEVAGEVDHAEVYIRSGDRTLTIIHPFTMPAVPPSGPLCFCAAMFEPEYLDLDHLISNGAVWEFELI